jgi:hypothetical protein
MPGVTRSSSIGFAFHLSTPFHTDIQQNTGSSPNAPSHLDGDSKVPPR